MDYAFCPGGTPYDGSSRLLLSRRPDTILINIRTIRDVETFLEHLVATRDASVPIGDILLYTHGNASGHMAIDLDHTSTEPDPKGGVRPATSTTYEVLEQAIKSQSLKTLLDELYGGPPPVVFDLHIRGCRIGKSLPFMNALQMCLHSPHSVTAPLHFHESGGIGSRSKKLKYGSYECLSYGFELSRHPMHKFGTWEEAIDVFKDQFKFIDESEIPVQIWKKWIPKNLRPRAPKRWVKLGLDIGRGIRSIKLPHAFRHRIDTQLWWRVDEVTKNPGSDAEREVIFRESITAENADEAFKPSHPFPVYERLGFPSLTDFLDGHKWKCNWWKKRELHCFGTRHVYTVIVPIVDPISQHLFFNLFPADGSGLLEVKHLSHDDPLLFRTVLEVPNPE